VTTVGHYVERWLELSAGFVAAHVERSRHHGIVISRDGWVEPQASDYRPRYSLAPIRDRTPERFKPLALHAQLAALLALRRVDVVHVHFGYAANDVLAVTERRPYVLSLHGHDVTGLISDDPDRYREVAQSADVVIVPSQFLSAAAIRAGFARERIRVIPSGVDTSFFTPTGLPYGPPVVGFVGRFVEKKGIDTLMAAWPAIAASVPEARLHLVGDGPLRPLVPSDDDRITLSKPDASRSREQVRDLIHRATVVVTPSHEAIDGDSESLLLVNLEAAASGRPVVSTRHGGIPEYVADGRSGLLVEPADPAGFAAAVIRLLRDRDLARALATAAPDLVRQWDVRTCTAQVDDLYDELVLRRQGRGRN
jgi:colanic acid/amylovoran biosynthesis glycosyltransferase